MTLRTKLAYSFFLTAIIGGATQQAIAANTYYLSTTSGNDANEGQSPEKAWQHLSKLYLKSVSANSFQPGDSILLKRGDHWDGQIHMRANGTASAPITIGAYSSGPKPLLLGNAQPLWQPVAGHTGIYTTDLGQGTIPGMLLQDGNNLRVIYPVETLKSNEDMERFLARVQPETTVGRSDGKLWIRMNDAQPPNEKVRVFEYAGVALWNSSFVQVENLDIERFSVGIDIENSYNIVIRHNDIRQVLGMGIYLRSADSDCQVESNTVSHSGNTALYVLKGARNIFRDNWVSHVATSVLGIKTAGDHMGIGLQESAQTLVEYNDFAYSGGIDFYFERHSTIRYNYLYRVTSAGSPHGTNLKVYGNIYNLSHANGEAGSTGVNAVATGPGTISVFNNTILNASGFFLKGSSSKGGQVAFSNNIAASNVTSAALLTFGPNVTSNHNCFFTPAQPSFTYSQASFHSLADYQEKSGLDKDSVFADPQFVSAAPVTPLDFRISAGSGCNASALDPDLTEQNATYDYDQAVSRKRSVGAFSETADKPADEFRTLCTDHCLGRSFDAPRGVYLVAIKFAAEALSKTSEATFMLNGTRVVANSAPSLSADSKDDSSQYFLVRPSDSSITFEPETGADNSMITEIKILRFDASHGEGAQVVSW